MGENADFYFWYQAKYEFNTEIRMNRPSGVLVDSKNIVGSLGTISNQEPSLVRGTNYARTILK